VSGAHTVQQALAGCPLPPREARALLAHVRGVPRERLVARPAEPVAADELERFEALARRRASGEPLAYLLQRQEFYGHELRVTPDVLVPRPETELLVDRALAARDGACGARVLDLGTGSGCVAIALALARPHWQVAASDRSAAALQVAQENCTRLGARVALRLGDWYEAAHGRYDLIVSNPPYIAAGDVHLPRLAAEPRAALTDEGDGLGALRRIIAGAPAHLAAGGQLLVEHGYDQGAAVRALLAAAGLAQVRSFEDLEGRERVGTGRWDGPVA
jgi:release factor glutamine methyltransferase